MLLKGRGSLYRIASIYYMGFTLVQGAFLCLFSFIALICTLMACGEDGKKSLSKCFYLFYLQDEYPSSAKFITREKFQILMIMEFVINMFLTALSGIALKVFLKWHNKSRIKMAIFYWTRTIILISLVDFLFSSLFLVDIIQSERIICYNCYNHSVTKSEKSLNPESLNLKENQLDKNLSVNINKFSADTYALKNLSIFDDEITFDGKFDAMGFKNVKFDPDGIQSQSFYDLLKEKENESLDLSVLRHFRKRDIIENDELFGRSNQMIKFENSMRRKYKRKKHTNKTYSEMENFDLNEYFREIIPSNGKSTQPIPRRNIFYDEDKIGIDEFSVEHIKPKTERRKIIQKTTQMDKDIKKITNLVHFLSTTSSSDKNKDLNPTLYTTGAINQAADSEEPLKEKPIKSKNAQFTKYAIETTNKIIEWVLCESPSYYFECAQGVIDIVSAFYGREYDSQLCGTPYLERFYKCGSGADTLNNAQQRCNGLRRCELNSWLFRNLCPRETKYLKIKLQCKLATTTVKTTPKPIKLNKDILALGHPNLEISNRAIALQIEIDEAKKDFLKVLCSDCKKWSIMPALILFALSIKMGIVWFLNILCAFSIIHLSKVTERSPALLFTPKF